LSLEVFKTSTILFKILQACHSSIAGQLLFQQSFSAFLVTGQAHPVNHNLPPVGKKSSECFTATVNPFFYTVFPCVIVNLKCFNGVGHFLHRFRVEVQGRVLKLFGYVVNVRHPDWVAFSQKAGKIGTILSGNAKYQGTPGHEIILIFRSGCILKNIHSTGFA
jgi:hypothetical protein